MRKQNSRKQLFHRALLAAFFLFPPAKKNMISLKSEFLPAIFFIFSRFFD